MSNPVPQASQPPRNAIVRAGNFPAIRARNRPFAPHRDVYHWVLTRSWFEFFLLVAACFLGTNALFACAYLLVPGSILNARPGSFEDAFFFSVQTSATIGYGSMSPVTTFAHACVTLEALTSILGVALVTGITFAKFSRPTSRIVFSDKIVVAPRDGVPHMMWRLANARHNSILEARINAILLLRSRTAEGQEMYIPHEIPLVRDRTALLSLTWTVMHRIDEKSPFHGPDAIAKLNAQDGAIFLTVSGTDETVSQMMHARCAFALEDIVYDHIFADVLTREPDGTRVIDYETFHAVVPIANANANASTNTGTKVE